MHGHNQKYYAGSYKRLSKEDKIAVGSCKNESNSISNQRELIQKFVKSHSEIEIVKEYADDGFSGVDFERPDFLRMLEDIKAGVINCVIVKDLSRFGRNYIEVGKYLEEIFPVLGVRFIAINENYDSIYTNKGNEQLVIPFMNLVNDAYCRDISIKTRTSFAMKQQKGEYIGSYAPYGYKKRPHDIHHFMIDEEAADVVKRIFEWTVEGMSNRAIADKLNLQGIPSPAEYKRLHEKNYSCHFQRKAKALWTPLSIRKILGNRVYIGTIEQGKTYSINYKVKKRIKRSKEQWYQVENAHEPVIDKETFYLVQKLLGLDVRTCPGEEAVYLFSGIVICGKCGETLLRRRKVVKGREYVYYGCYDGNKKLCCENVCIREDKLKQAVLETLKKHIATAVKMSELLAEIKELPYQEKEVRSLDHLILEKEKEILKYQRLKMKLFEDYHDKFIGKEEYKDFEAIYRKKEEEAVRKKEDLELKRQQLLQGDTQTQKWVEQFQKYENIESLNRTLLLMLAEQIIVHSRTEIEVLFRYRDEFEISNMTIMNYLSSDKQKKEEQYGESNT